MTNLYNLEDEDNNEGQGRKVKYESNLKKRRQLKKTSIVLSEEKLKKLSTLYNNHHNETISTIFSTPLKDSININSYSVTTPSSCESIKDIASNLSSLPVPLHLPLSPSHLHNQKNIKSKDIFLKSSSIFRGYLIRNSLKKNKKLNEIINLQHIILEEFYDFVNLKKNQQYFTIEISYSSRSSSLLSLNSIESASLSSINHNILSPSLLKSSIKSIKLYFTNNFLIKMNTENLESFINPLEFNCNLFWISHLKYFLLLYDTILSLTYVRDPQRILINALINKLLILKNDLCNQISLTRKLKKNNNIINNKLNYNENNIFTTDNSSFIKFDQEEINEQTDSDEVKRLVQSVLEDYNNESIIIEEELLSPFNRIDKKHDNIIFNQSSFLSSSQSNNPPSSSFLFNSTISSLHPSSPNREDTSLINMNTLKEEGSNMDNISSFLSYYSENNSSSNPLLGSVSDFNHSKFNPLDNSNKGDDTLDSIVEEDVDTIEIEEVEVEHEAEVVELDEIEEENDDSIIETFTPLFEIIDNPLSSNLSKGFLSLNKVVFSSISDIKFLNNQVRLAIALPTSSNILKEINSVEKLYDVKDRFLLSLPLSIPTLKSHLNYYYGKNCKLNQEKKEEILDNSFNETLDPSIFSLTFVPLPPNHYISLLSSLFRAWIIKKGGVLRIDIESKIECDGEISTLYLTNEIELESFVSPLLHFLEDNDEEIERPCVNFDRIIPFSYPTSSTSLHLPSTIEIFLSFSLFSPSQDYLFDTLSSLILSERKKKISSINISKIKRKSPEKISRNEILNETKQEDKFSRTKRIEEMINLAFSEEQQGNDIEDEESKNIETNSIDKLAQISIENSIENELESSFSSSTLKESFITSPSVNFRSQFMQTLTKTPNLELEKNVHSPTFPSPPSSPKSFQQTFGDSFIKNYTTPPRVPRSVSSTPLKNISPNQFETPERNKNTPPSSISNKSPSTSKMIESLKSQLETLQSSHESASKAMLSFQNVLNKRNTKEDHYDKSFENFIAHKQEFPIFEESNSSIKSEDEIIITKSAIPAAPSTLNKEDTLNSTKNSFFSHIINEDDEKKFDPNNNLAFFNKITPLNAPNYSTFSEIDSLKDINFEDDLDDIENFDTSFIKSMVWNDSILEDDED